MTPAELTILKAGIQAQTDPTFVGYRTQGQTGLMAEWLSAPHASVKAWDAAAPWARVLDAIDYAKYTPSAANLPSDTAGLCRLVAILLKLTVQQNMLIGMGQVGVNARNAATVGALLDTVTAVPAGAGGANVAPGGAGGSAVAAALARPALRVEAIFGGADVQFGGVTAKTLVREGGVSDADVVEAINLP